MTKTKPKTKPRPAGNTVTLRLPRAMKKQLMDMAAREDLTVSQIIRRHFASILTDVSGKEKP